METEKELSSEQKRNLRYSSYRINNVREKNKAKRVVKNVMRSRTPEATLRELQLKSVVRTFANKLYYKKGN